MNDFDDIIRRAVAGRAEAAPGDVPDFANVLAARQDRLRRRTAVAAGGLVVAGLAGIGVFATATDDSPGVAGGESTTARFDATPVTTTIPPDAVWYCTGRVDDLGLTPDATVGTAPLPAVDPAMTTTTRPPQTSVDPTAPVTPMSDVDSGYFRHCSLVSADLGDGEVTTTFEVVEGTAPPTSALDDEAGDDVDRRRDAEEAARREASELEARRLAEEGVVTHIVEDGESVDAIAERYCIPLDELLAHNGWSAPEEFGSPGDLVVIPPRSTSIFCPGSPPTTAGG